MCKRTARRTSPGGWVTARGFGAEWRACGARFRAHRCSCERTASGPCPAGGWRYERRARCAASRRRMRLRPLRCEWSARRTRFCRRRRSDRRTSGPRVRRRLRADDLELGRCSRQRRTRLASLRDLERLSARDLERAPLRARNGAGRCLRCYGSSTAFTHGLAFDQGETAVSADTHRAMLRISCKKAGSLEESAQFLELQQCRLPRVQWDLRRARARCSHPRAGTCGGVVDTRGAELEAARPSMRTRRRDLAFEPAAPGKSGPGAR